VGLWKGKSDNEQANGPSWVISESGAPADSESYSQRLDQIQSALSSGTKIEGKLAFAKPVRIDGELKGLGIAPVVLVVLGPDAKVDAQLEAAVLVILGEVRGSVHALQRVELLAGGSMTGDIETRQLMIQQGSCFNGTCKMPELAAQPQETAAKPEESWFGGRKDRDRKKKGKDDVQQPGVNEEPKAEDHSAPLIP